MVLALGLALRSSGLGGHVFVPQHKDNNEDDKRQNNCNSKKKPYIDNVQVGGFYG